MWLPVFYGGVRFFLIVFGISEVANILEVGFMLCFSSM